jgi:hypothetical protein
MIAAYDSLSKYSLHTFSLSTLFEQLIIFQSL